MEQKFEKNFIEKFGDFYSHAGRRALFSLGCIAFGVIVELVLAGVGVGAFFLFCAFITCCLFAKKKRQGISKLFVLHSLTVM